MAWSLGHACHTVWGQIGARSVQGSNGMGWRWRCAVAACHPTKDEQRLVRKRRNPLLKLMIISSQMEAASLQGN